MIQCLLIAYTCRRNTHASALTLAALHTLSLNQYKRRLALYAFSKLLATSFTIRPAFYTLNSLNKTIEIPLKYRPSSHYSQVSELLHFKQLDIQE